MTFDIVSLTKQFEGLRLKPYRDSVGKLTIGYGRNLSDDGITETEAEQLLQNDLQKARAGVLAGLPWVANLDDARQAVLFEMAFQIGLSGLFAFKNTLTLVQAGNYAGAADAMLQSMWFKQTPDRAQALSDIMRNGQ
jgi:lysozyme